MQKLTWLKLNEILLDYNEKDCQVLLNQELEGQKRKTYLKRIHSRLNYLRAQREREELNVVK